MNNEVKLSKYYSLKKQSKANILELKLPEQAYEGYDWSKLEPRLLKDIQTKLNSYLSILETRPNPWNSPKNRIMVILRPIATRQGKNYPILMHAKTTTPAPEGGRAVTSDEYGHAYGCVVNRGSIISIFLYNQDDLTPERLIEKTKTYIQSEYPKFAKDGYQIINVTSSEYKIDIDTVMKGVDIDFEKALVSKDSLDYKVRTDYRKGGDFRHKKYGVGTIVNTSSGVTGQPNQQGKLDWVDVDFHKSYIDGGKVQRIRRMPNVYATAYWLSKK